MQVVSAWAAVAADQLIDCAELIHVETQSGLSVDLRQTDDTLWIVASRGKGKIAFRTAFSPDMLVLTQHHEKDGILYFFLRSAIGSFKVRVELPTGTKPVIHFSVSFQPSADFFIPFWPRDILLFDQNGLRNAGSGEVYIRQAGIRTGMIFAGAGTGDIGSFLYLQNFTALGNYCQQTGCSVADTVGGSWPELGFALPVNPEKPLAAGEEYIISDAFIAFDNSVPDDQFEVATSFLNALADIYLFYPRPKTIYHDYPDILAKSIRDLSQKKGCWSEYEGRNYLNAYLCDYETPAEIMVQLAVLLPILDYQEWSGETLAAATDLRDGLSAFYDDKLKVIKRWLPSAEDRLDGAEEQKVPDVMDSWYLHHPLLNLSRMALKGDEVAKKLFLESLDYTIRVARHFNYRWPVFYNMQTLDVVKAETKEGEGGEKDVAGIYAHVMLQAWELTGDKRYFREAEKAARTLADYGFDVFYQANNTAFSAGAMLRLFRETKDDSFLKLAYLLIANLFKNISLWQCEYGPGKHFPRFFSLFPLNDAPYSAVYEEQECFAAIHDFFEQSREVSLLPSVSLLLAEFVKYAITRMPFYYPPLLPKEMLSDEVKTGQLDPEAWIALEDICDGWEKSGSVGQEVYGAGLAFGVAPRHYLRVRDQGFMIFVDYPADVLAEKEGELRMRLRGSEKLSCSLKIIKTSDTPLPQFIVSGTKMAGPGTPRGKRTAHIDYILNGNQEITINWNTNERKDGKRKK